MERLGLTYHHTRHPDGTHRPYWDETTYYVFSMAEVLELERVTTELHEMCVAAARHIVERRRYAELRIPPWVVPAVEQSWYAQPPTLYGRLDLSYDGIGPAKLLEYNADTPTALVEAAVVQWQWLEDVHPGADQWNSLHEALVERWRALAPALPGPLLHVVSTSADDSGEDLMTAAYVQDTAEQAGLRTVGMHIEDVGLHRPTGRFVDLMHRPMTSIFKLYPWEWLVTDRFGPAALSNGTTWVEPVWKMLLSNKALLAILWELYPGHPNLLPASLAGPPAGVTEFVRKPLLGREGANVQVVAGADSVVREGPYGAEGWVWQAYAPLPRTAEAGYPVLGSWVVGAEPAGLGIRESATPVTDDLSRFVPHLIDG